MAASCGQTPLQPGTARATRRSAGSAHRASQVCTQRSLAALRSTLSSRCVFGHTGLCITARVLIKVLPRLTTRPCDLWQLYMFFMMWRFQKRLEHYQGMKGPFYGGEYSRCVPTLTHVCLFASVAACAGLALASRLRRA